MYNYIVLCYFLYVLQISHASEFAVFFVPSILCGAFCLKVNILCELAVLSC